MTSKWNDSIKNLEAITDSVLSVMEKKESLLLTINNINREIELTENAIHDYENPTMSTADFQNIKKKLGLNDIGISNVLNIDIEVVECWSAGQVSIPGRIAIALRNLRNAKLKDKYREER